MDDNTQRGQHAHRFNIPEVSLHVDLVWTDLEDFVEHFESQLRWAIERMQYVRKFHDPLLGEVDNHHPLWDEEIEYYESPTPEATSWGTVGPGRYLRIAPTREKARVIYLVDEWTDDLHQPDSPASLRFSLIATRYRRDRLKIVVYEYSTPTGYEYAPKVKSWLEKRWGEDGVIERSPKSAPLPPRLPSRDNVYQENDVKTTLVHYLVEKRHKTQRVASDLVGVSEKTYRTHRDRKLLLSDDEFHSRTGESIEDAARGVIRGQWWDER